jgi:hypothetical protein
MGSGEWKEKIDHYLVKWLSAYLDEGVSAWNLPHRERGFYRSWRSMAVHDREIFFWGLKEGFSEIPGLPDNPEDTLLGSPRIVSQTTLSAMRSPFRGGSAMSSGAQAGPTIPGNRPTLLIW